MLKENIREILVNVSIIIPKGASKVEQVMEPILNPLF
jgi:hypothetical protein